MTTPGTRIVDGTVVKVIDANQVQIKYTKPDTKLVIMKTSKAAHKMKLNEVIDVVLTLNTPWSFLGISKKGVPLPLTTDKGLLLNLNLLQSGGGAWNVTKLKMMKSTITKFENSTVLRCHYDINSGTSADPGVGGFSFVAVPVGMNTNALSLSWDVYYPTGFQFARGGKFGGISNGQGAAGGGNHSSTASSNRVMWQEDGGIIDYIYLPTDTPQIVPGLKSDGFGIGLFKNDFAQSLKTNAWNRITIGTKINTFIGGVPQNNGETYVIVNGVKRSLKGINWSNSPDFKISNISIGNFFGGPTPSPVEQFCYFKNIKVGKF